VEQGGHSDEVCRGWATIRPPIQVKLPLVQFEHSQPNRYILSKNAFFEYSYLFFDLN